VRRVVSRDWLRGSDLQSALPARWLTLLCRTASWSPKEIPPTHRPTDPPSRWVEPHVSLQLPVSPCCGPLVPQLRAGRSWLWRGAIRNPTGCPVESASRAARQPSVPAPSRSVSAAPSPAASAPKRQLIAPPQPRPAQVLSGRRTLIRALGASGGTRQRRPSAVVSAR
jgi:hypothetical protein